MKQLHTFVAGIALLCLSLSSLAQTETNTSFASQMNAVFANLEKARVPYGILRDYGMEFTNLEQYNGTAPLADSNATDASTFWEVYNTLVTSRIHTNASGFVRPDTLDKPVIVQSWGFSMAVAPNPTSDNLAVSLTDDSPDANSSSSEETINMKLYNSTSIMVERSWVFKKGQNTYHLNLRGLKPGNYILVVQKGKYQQSKQVSIR